MHPVITTLLTCSGQKERVWNMRGFYVAQEGHTVNLIPPVDVNGGVTSGVFSMKNWAHASILLQLGVTASAPTKVSLLSSDNQSPESTTAIPFDVYKCETAYNAANGDVLGAKVSCTAAAGFVPSATDNIFYRIEIDAASLPDGQPYVKLVIAAGASAIAAANVTLTGGRNAADQSATVTA
jgi:hypothetical protein